MVFLSQSTCLRISWGRNRKFLSPSRDYWFRITEVGLRFYMLNTLPMLFLSITESGNHFSLMLVCSGFQPFGQQNIFCKNSCEGHLVSCTAFPSCNVYVYPYQARATECFVALLPMKMGVGFLDWVLHMKNAYTSVHVFIFHQLPSFKANYDLWFPSWLIYILHGERTMWKTWADNEVFREPWRGDEYRRENHKCRMRVLGGGLLLIYFGLVPVTVPSPELLPAKFFLNEQLQTPCIKHQSVTHSIRCLNVHMN